MRLQIFAVVLVSTSVLGCAAEDEPDVERALADLDVAGVESAQVDCEAPCATQLPMASLCTEYQVWDPTPCELDALAIDPDAIVALADCMIPVEEAYVECVNAPSCGDYADFNACRDIRSAGLDACGDIPVEVEIELDQCDADED